MNPERVDLEALGIKIPDSITPVVAYRSWRISATGCLTSHNGTTWTPGKAMKAECRMGIGWHDRLIGYYGLQEGGLLMKKCSCGLYAAKPERADGIVPRGPRYIYGEVYLWGKILEHNGGYRAEYAYPKQFFVRDSKQKKLVESLGFGVPVTVVRGVSSFRFPFPAANQTEKTKRRLRGFYSTPFLPGLPALVVAAVDACILDMSRTYSQILVSVLSTVGLAAAALSIYTHRLMRRIKI